MGDTGSKVAQCTCCGPQEDPQETEAQLQLHAPNVAANPVPPGAFAQPPAAVVGSYAEGVPGGPLDFMPNNQWDDVEDDQSAIFVPLPPPPAAEIEPKAPERDAAKGRRREDAAQASGRSPPPPPSSGPPKAPRPAPLTPSSSRGAGPPAVAAAAAASGPGGVSRGPSGTSAAATGSRGGAGAALDLEVVLCDLEGAEVQTYGRNLRQMGGGPKGVTPDNEQLRDFVLSHSAISSDELDVELLKVADSNPDFCIDTDGLIQIMRNHALAENDLLQQFISLSPDGTEISSEDCRSGLLNLLQQRLNTDWPEAVAEQVFDSIMTDAGLKIDMEQWTGYCQRLGRIARLNRILRLEGRAR